MQFDFPFLAVLRDKSCGLDMCILTDRDVYTRERIGVVSVPTGSVSGPQLSAAHRSGHRVCLVVLVGSSGSSMGVVIFHF